MHNDEPYAANTLTVGQTTLVNDAFPKTEKRLRELGIVTQAVDLSAFHIEQASVTGLSLIMESRASKASSTEPGLTVIDCVSLSPPDRLSAQAIVHGNLVYVSQQTPPQTPLTMTVEEQTIQVLSKVSVILTAAGSSISRVIRATVHLAEGKLWQQVGPVCVQTFGSHRPTYSVITNGALPEKVAVQIEVVAALADRSC